MEIVIVGAGKVGEELCVVLVNEGHDVTLIDKDSEKIETFIEKVDIKGIVGNGAVLDVQLDANVPDCDVFIAVTPQDENNIMATVIAKKLGAKYCVARIRNPEYVTQMDFVRAELGIDVIINPDQEAALEIIGIFDFPSALQVEPLAGGKVNIIKVRIENDSELVGSTVAGVRQKVPDLIICIIQRKNQAFIPNGDTVFLLFDEIYLVGDKNAQNEFCRLAGVEVRPFKSALIVGGGRIARYLIPYLLRRSVHTKVIEIDKEAAGQLAVTFPKVEVIVGDGTSQSFLKEERLKNYDTVISLTNVDEENLLLSMFAGQQGVRKTVTKVNRTDLIRVLDPENIDTIITPYGTVADLMVKFVRELEQSRNASLCGYARLANNTMEVLEFNAMEANRAVGIPIRNLKLKGNLLILLLLRGDLLIFPKGSDQIASGDQVVVLNQVPQNVRELDDILL